MKKTFSIFLSAILLSSSAFATPSVQRTLDSSYDEYRKYLSQSGKTSFVDGFIQLSAAIELETPLLERCLEEVYLGAPADTTCLTAVKSLASKPLNSVRREVLFSFLLKLEKIKTAQKSFYRDLKLGLLKTDPKLAQTFHASTPNVESEEGVIQDLEMKAWKKALARKFPLDEIALLINGIRISKLEKWSAPRGVYQWSLVSNTHEPFVRLGTFSQFAAESLKELKPLADLKCKDIEDMDPQKFGMIQLEVFSNSKCVAQFGLAPSVAKTEPHLGNSATMVQMEKSSNRHWIWPAVALLVVGIGASLKDKQVSIEMPGAH